MDFVDIASDAFRASGLGGTLYPFDDEVYYCIPKGQGTESVDLLVVKRRQDVLVFAAGTTSGDILYQGSVVPLIETEVRGAVEKLIAWAKEWVSSTPT
jgi:hypothetical protein